MWEQKEFAKHWRNEFPDGEVPQMDINTVEDIALELEACKTNLKRLQKALAEEKFKVIYLQTTVDQQRRNDPKRFEGKDENFNADTFSKMGNVRKSNRRSAEGDGQRSRVSNTQDVELQLPGNPGGLTSSFSRERSGFSGKAGKPVPIPIPPRKFSQRGDTAASGVFQPSNNGESSDREYEDTELNENFVRNNLVAPKSVSRENQRTASKAHRDVLRPFRHSRDLDSGDDGRLSPSFAQIHSRTSRGSGCSTPERRSDGYLSSDHDDDSSGGKDSNS
ncbi:hypothetical protein LDENG_00025880 [Lucifuga dentata]|nr:hypothetical protein LDENG_00025880 [Lucifuga dentata]